MNISRKETVQIETRLKRPPSNRLSKLIILVWYERLLETLIKTYLACMNDCSDPKTNDNFFDITKDFMSYFDQFYIKTCFRQVWKIVKCKLLEVLLLVTCKSASLNWPATERSHVLLLFYLSCKLKRVGRLHDVKQLFWKPANDKNCFKLPLRYKLNQVWRALTC